MKQDGQNGHNDSDAMWVRNTLIFRQWEDMKKDILLHKWLESEKAGHDIGMDHATFNWMIKSGSDTPNKG